MTIMHINRELCRECSLRTPGGCPVVEACPTDVIRADQEAYPYISYPTDCHSCFLCELDCPGGAVRVSPDIPMPIIPY